MPCRLAIGAATALAALALAGPAAAQQVKFNGGLLYHQETLTPGVKSFKVTCPAGHVAVSGGVFVIGAQTKQITSVPGPGARVWTFGFGYAGTGQSTVIVLVTCIKPNTKKVKVAFKTAKTTFTVAPLKSRTKFLTCPERTAPVGSGGIAQVGSRSRSAPRARAADIPLNQVAIESRLVPVRGGFETTWDNPAQEPAQVTAVARCMARKAKRKRRRRKPKRVTAEVTRRTFTETVRPGSNRFTHDCGPGRAAITAGWAFPPMSDLRQTHAIQRTGEVNLVIDAVVTSTAQIQLHLLCVRGRLTFQRDV